MPQKPKLLSKAEFAQKLLSGDPEVQQYVQDIQLPTEAKPDPYLQRRPAQESDPKTQMLVSEAMQGRMDGGKLYKPTQVDEYLPNTKSGKVDPRLAKGDTVPGNIDLKAQPKVQNPDGTVSTIDSRSYGIDGKEVLLPSVTPDGRHLKTDKEIINEYLKTGRHLGKFNSVEDANAHAQKLHEDYANGVYDQPDNPPNPDQPSGVKKAWDWANTPLVPQIGEAATKVANKIDEPHLDTSKLMAQIKGFLAGSTASAGKIASELTSPIQLATLAAGAAGKAGVAGAKGVSAALQAPMVAEGTINAIKGKSTGEKLAGVGEAASGLAGVLDPIRGRLSDMANENGVLRLEHRSNIKGLTTVDPAYHGTGQKGAEYARSTEPDYKPRSMYNVEGTPAEARFRNSEPYHTSVADESKIYDLEQDPLNLRDKAVKEAGATKNSPTTVMENLIGKVYDGFKANGAVVMFKALPVKPGLSHAANIANLVSKGDGATYNLTKGNLLGTKHYAVGMYPDRNLVIPNKPTLEDYHKFLDSNKDLLADPENSVGVWHNPSTGKYELDISKTVPELSRAFDMGRSTKQDAIFDLLGKKDIAVPPSGPSGLLKARP